MLNNSVVLEMEGFEDISLRLPEHNLLIALLNRALLDYLGTQAAERQEAEDWLFDESDLMEPFTYAWVCAQLGIQPGYLLSGVKIMRDDTAGRAKRWYLQRGKSEQLAA